MAKTSAIYGIFHDATGRVYVGSTVDIPHRWKQHRADLRHDVHFNSYLQRAWLRYGEQAFSFVVLESVEPSRLIEREQHYIQLLRATDRRFGFNRRIHAQSNLGIKARPETLAKMSAAGFAQPSEVKAKISASLRGKIQPPEVNAKRAATMRLAWQNGLFSSRPLPTPQTIANRAAALRGRKRSGKDRERLVEHCRRLSEAQRGVPQTAEHIRKRSEAMKANHAKRKEGLRQL